MSEYAARILEFVAANPGVGVKRIQEAIPGRSSNISTAVSELLGAGKLANDGTAACKRLRVTERVANDAPAVMAGAGRRIFVLPDVHVPYHDEAATEVALSVARELRPDVIVIIGDLIDCYAVSNFPKSPERRQDLKWEIDQANEFLDRLNGIATTTVFCEGNHENRLERYLCQRAPELYGMVQIKDLLRIGERGWTWVPYKQWIKIGKVAFAHEVGRCGKNTAMQSMADFGGNVVIGHSHRAGAVYGGTVDGDRHFGLNVGWLGSFGQVDYAHRSQMRDWQHGFGWIEQDDDGNSWAQFCPIVKGRTVVQGRRFA